MSVSETFQDATQREIFPDVLAAAQDQARIVKIAGCARSGKTEALLERCGILVDMGVAPESILIEAATSFAVQALRHRLATRISFDMAERVFIMTPTEACLRVLATDHAQAATGRGARLLTDLEYKFFLEDLKTTGVKSRVISGMLSTFFQQWADLEAEEDWTSAGRSQEFNMLTFIRRHLRDIGGMLKQEVGYVCARYLKSDAGAPDARAFEYVFCDDFQNMTRSEQTSLCLMVNKQLVVAGNVNQTLRPAQEHPYPYGFDQFDALRHNVSVHTLSHAFGNPYVQRFAAALEHHGDMDSDAVAESFDNGGTSALVVRWNSPQDELNNITKYLRSCLSDLEKPVESNVCLVAPNRTWAIAAQRVCKRRGFEVSMDAAGLALGGDPREAAGNHGLKAYTLLNLLANPKDVVAWRCWCGYDNYLTNSDAWKNLSDWAHEQEIGIIEALDRLLTSDDIPFLRADALKETYRRGCEFIRKNARRRGFDLLHAIGANKVTKFMSVAQRIAGNEDAVTLFAITQQDFAAPVFPDNIHALRIALPENLIGLEFDTVYVLGVVSGFYPPRGAFEVTNPEKKRERLINESRRLFVNTINKATSTLFVSLFNTADLELAESSKLQIKRIYSENGKRVARLCPSMFLQEAQSAYPGTIGGQQLMGTRGLE